MQQGQQQFNQFTDGQVTISHLYVVWYQNIVTAIYPEMFYTDTHFSANIVQILNLLLHRLNVLQQLYQIQPVTMPAGQELTQTMFIQSTNQTADAQVTQVSTD